MRCLKCGNSNPENNKFCGMCGSKLQPVSIDDNDPLEIEIPTYHSESSARFGSPQRAELREIGRRGEELRDAVSRPAIVRQRVITGSAVENLDVDAEQRNALEEEPRSRRPQRTPPISGPSFLGLGSEASNTGFVYDEPRDNAYVYDSPSETPEYLLTEVSRGVSWRAWALFLLLLIGAGLGYIQWRASQHQGPDLAAILSGNGAILDPNHPTVDTNGTKPRVQKGNAAATDSSQADAAKAAGSAKKDDQDDSSGPDANASAPATANSDSTGRSDSLPVSAESGSKDSHSTTTNGAADSLKDSAKSTSPMDSDKSATGKKVEAKENADAHIESNSNDKTTGSNKVPGRVEEPAKPKSLGEKDPLLIQADKYIRGRGVRQNCSAGVNLLREAVSAGNPEASVKLGALYWSGTCVTPSKVTAYQWFSRAHSLQPTNRWIERSRNSLWANLSPQEKQRVGGY